jgi:hypothetical protein
VRRYMMLEFEVEKLTRTYIGRHDVNLISEWQKQILEISKSEIDS